MWYVVQVSTGAEERIRLQCEKKIDKSIMEEEVCGAAWGVCSQAPWEAGIGPGKRSETAGGFEQWS